ncbi:hypothetical protein [Butyricimonas sp.]|uniref:hypothetical protein n=1 Tax=Butyricimonas sp. TaxID=1969738 RepID=UPI0025BDCD45|nr:hypothetical protein [Butyricimonas sp.]
MDEVKIFDIIGLTFEKLVDYRKTIFFEEAGGIDKRILDSGNAFICDIPYEVPIEEIEMI